MPTLLHIDSAIADHESRSRALTAECVEGWLSRGAMFNVVTRDLDADPPPYLNERSQHWPEELREGASLRDSTAQRQERLIAELLAADVVVVGAPMYNYAMPSPLKSWIDLVHVPGLTAAFDVSTQPLSGRTAIIVTTRGGAPDPEIDGFVTDPLRKLFGEGFGMDVHVVAATRTLVNRIPSLGVDLAEREFASALSKVYDLGATAVVPEA